jgi:hypothetical protein
MARVEHLEQFLTPSSESACLDGARTELTLLGGLLQHDGASEVVASFGSGARTRIFGPLFVFDATLPVRVRVTVDRVDHATRVSIRAEKAISFVGIGVRGKFQSRFRSVALHVRYALEGQLGTVTAGSPNRVNTLGTR